MIMTLVEQRPINQNEQGTMQKFISEFADALAHDNEVGMLVALQKLDAHDLLEMSHVQWLYDDWRACAA